MIIAKLKVTLTAEFPLGEHPANGPRVIEIASSESHELCCKVLDAIVRQESGEDEER